MKKKVTIDQIEKSVAVGNSEVGNNGKNNDRLKTPIKFQKKNKIKHLRLYIVLGVIAVIFGCLGYFGWVIYGSLSNVFSSGGAPNLLNIFDNKQLKGENTGRINILLLGVGDDGHAGQYLSDTIMVVSYDVKTKQVAMISIPRDLYVNIGEECGSAKINYAHACGEIEKLTGGGPAISKNVVSEVLDIPINYYARVDFTGLKDIVDAIGGVEINVTEDLYDPFYPNDDGLKGADLYIKKGQQHMAGAMALRYARSRETTTDFDRARRQQQILVAIKDKVMSAETFLNPAKISEIATALGSHLKTDFSIDELPRAIDIFKNVDTSKIKNKVFDNSKEGLLIDDSSTSAGYILLPRLGEFDYTDLQRVALNIFSNNSKQTENAEISVQNGTTTPGLASKAADVLKKANYNVIDISTADSSQYQQTKIIDYSNGGKKSTLAELEKQFNVKSTAGSGDSLSGADIVVIIGQDYKPQ